MQSLLLTLHAQTSIHAGSGQSDNVIDLPVQREAHTAYPCIFGSSIKGAIRAHAQHRLENYQDEMVFKLFGKEGDGENSNAGAAMMSDARILLLPIRSLTGQFKFVTCPAVLNRFKQDAKRFGMQLDIAVPEVAAENILLQDKEQNIYLEEYRFNNAGKIDEKWIKQLAQCLDYDNAVDVLNNQLAIINDDDFAYLAKYTLPVNAHIALDSQTKTTKNGALWYEETMPADSVLYVGVAIEDERKKDGQKAAQLLQNFENIFNENPWLQVGGNETVGMGWCSVRVAKVAS